MILTPNSIYFVICFLLTYSRGAEDYWSADFDSEQECKLRSRINDLATMKPSPCEAVKITEGEEKAFYDCKIKLSNNLQRSCDVRDDDIWQSLLYFGIVQLWPEYLSRLKQSQLLTSTG